MITKMYKHIKWNGWLKGYTNSISAAFICENFYINIWKCKNANKKCTARSERIRFRSSQDTAECKPVTATEYVYVEIKKQLKFNQNEQLQYMFYWVIVVIEKRNKWTKKDIMILLKQKVVQEIPQKFICLINLFFTFIVRVFWHLFSPTTHIFV